MESRNFGGDQEANVSSDAEVIAETLIDNRFGDMMI